MNLKELIAKNQTFSAEYHQGFSNHASMALIALHELGADEEKLNTFFDEYKSVLEPKPATKIKITDDNYHDILGKNGVISDYTEFFLEKLPGKNRDEILREYLNELTLGIPTAAFHPIIRMAYGLIINNNTEIMIGLAYLASQYHPLSKKLNTNSGEKNISQILETITQQNKPHILEYEQGFLTGRLQLAVNNYDIDDRCNQLKVTENTLADIAHHIANLYLLKPNILTLHLVTGCHALRKLLPYFSEQCLPLKTLLHAFIAAFIIEQKPDLTTNDVDESSLPSWNIIIENSLHQQDEHIIKLTFSCYEESQYYRDSIYQIIAAKITDSYK